MDAQTQERGPSADTTRQPERRPQQTPELARGAEAEQAESSPGKPSWRERLREHWIPASLAACLLLIALIGGVAYWLQARHFESTDDAFVAARSFSVAPKVSGYVAAVPVTDNQHVNAGDLLARIDDRDYRIAVDQAQAQVAVAQANVANIDAQIDSQQAQIDQARAQLKQAEAQLQFAREEADRAGDLVQKGAGTVQRAQQTKSDLEAQQANASRAKAAVIGAELGLKVLQTQHKSAEASKQQADAQLDQAKLNLQYTNVQAAQSGRVVKLSGAKGTFATAGQSLMMFVPDEVWITANYKETQLADMRPGQSVEIRIDAYPGRKLKGHVDSVQPGSGTAFSLLPAENATGNFVKVVQRVPVKIVVDDWPSDIPVGPGMSVVPWTRVR
ncbi:MULTISPECIES: HlyD family secretion protein [unclassified Bradyrhizobium]|uniref:HlyD family secretion protein n=1 Tax=unclassified Bradyrhizobium TaxID=2631580 RepID=UPI002FF191E6